MRPYEAMVILNRDLEEEAVDELLGQFSKVITDRGGEVEKAENAGKKRFAYEIKRMTEGYYALMHFNGDSEATAELERILKLSDGVVRHLLIRRDET